jgi:hypothetical protein
MARRLSRTALLAATTLLPFLIAGRDPLAQEQGASPDTRLSEVTARHVGPGRLGADGSGNPGFLRRTKSRWCAGLESNQRGLAANPTRSIGRDAPT